MQPKNSTQTTHSKMQLEERQWQDIPEHAICLLRLPNKVDNTPTFLGHDDARGPWLPNIHNCVVVTSKMCRERRQRARNCKATMLCVFTKDLHGHHRQTIHSCPGHNRYMTGRKPGQEGADLELQSGSQLRNARTRTQDTQISKA